MPMLAITPRKTRHSLRERILIVSKNNGFTLIEILLVILIIGVLVAIALPAFSESTIKAENKAAQADAQNLLTAAIANSK